MSLHARWRRARAAAIGTVTIGLLATGCGGSSGGSSTDPDTLIVYTGLAGQWQRNYNPYSPESIEGIGSIYEPLFFFNIARQDEPTSRLGTEFAWNDDGTELAITLREGVTWSDGEAFDAEDVAFTFDMIRDTPAFNSFGFDGSTEVVDANNVLVSFEEPSYMDAPQLLGKTYVVPEHIWSGIEEPETDIMADPIGTGPFRLGNFEPQAFTLEANPDYWDGEPDLKNVRYVALSGNQAGADALAAGEIDWQTGPVPDIANFERNHEGYKSITIPMNQMVLATCSNVELGCEGPQTDPAVRHAIFHAMDRDVLNSLAFQDTASEISPGFALPERDAAYVSAQLENRVANGSADTAQSEEILEAAGYQRGSDGIYAKDGVKLELSVRVVTGWTDYITAVNTMAEQLNEAGIKLNVNQASWNETTDARNSGNFQLAIDSLYPGASPDPYYVYYQFFHSQSTKPVGESANPNWARYANDEVDEALEELSQLDPDAGQDVRQPFYDTIQANIEQDMPYIPILVGGTTSQFNSGKFTGWPTDVNLYAFPAVWSRPDQSQIFANLKPAGE
ncbi:ABC transporter substrate-binding protein [Streptomyces sp. DSM 44915]|uniref:ABC transporter substrate-binding protein n=1 Tax=Streptomyces chisholmiae TaxID=3075540 RepID=A0ABU2JTV7_9ACTN|nr:ABC transporter substrate-binding protein [Streptomyces sp. DSM 44915]MDT0268422.1 ABC transporter substrate-binding protein [Streptomyces sp. DSM 44915]